MVSHKHTLAKTISYRALATAETMAIAWLLTGNWNVVFAFAAIETFFRLLTYYGHERFWVWIGKHWR